MSEIVEVPFQYGTCQRCGWDVEREPDGEWQGRLGGDCRSGDDLAEDGVHVVQGVRSGIRLHKLVEIPVATVTILAEDGLVLTEQEVPRWSAYEEFFTNPKVVAGFRASWRTVAYHAAVTDDEEAIYWASKESQRG